MLYTLSKAQYDLNELQQILAQITENDALVLWQDGVLLAVKYPQIFASISHIFVLANDLEARGLTLANYQPISFPDFIQVTEKFYPHIAF
ncbi:tRNA 2-thiouridine synthesizing protein B [Actinobacillus lignieresii]|uniref:sulfurtransferase complex subunit TusB n=1 Tax=Actinobacillus lignieresii TaxID=720 RepID=UPI000E18EFD0|nr:sulfurtransferase complex subunit TusB [Actinobacillus lignieresii]SUU00052.1 tRNA 2-thiouridine synthesizing protein B [Actinobacillus lignieresii]